MTKHCIECDRKVGGFFGRNYEDCHGCGEHVCTKCYKEEEGKYYCQRCYNKKSGGGCFIATACYGFNSDEVKILRHWRDNSLLINPIGKNFVNIYYWISPSIADFIRDKPLLKGMIKRGLSPLINTIKKRK